MSASWSGSCAADLAGISYRQLDYWARTDLCRPSLIDATGSGSRRRYTHRDLVELSIIRALLDAGIRLEALREVVPYLRANLGDDVATANLVIQRNQAVLVRDGAELIDLVQRGGGVLNVLPLAEVVSDLDGRIDARRAA